MGWTLSVEIYIQKPEKGLLWTSSDYAPPQWEESIGQGDVLTLNPHPSGRPVSGTCYSRISAQRVPSQLPGLATVCLTLDWPEG